MDNEKVEVNERETPWYKMLETLQHVVYLTNPDTPGVFEASTLENINSAARKVLGRPILAPEEWLAIPGSLAMSPQPEPIEAWHVEKVLSCLSGDLDYDSIAEAKRILKDLLS